MESKATAGNSVCPSSSKMPTQTQGSSPTNDEPQTSKTVVDSLTIKDHTSQSLDEALRPSKVRSKKVSDKQAPGVTVADAANSGQSSSSATSPSAGKRKSKYKLCAGGEPDCDDESSFGSESFNSFYGSRSSEDRRDFVVWEFLNEQGIWKPYDPLITRLVEKQRRKVAVVKLREVDAKMCNIVIDFKAMQQIRMDSGSMRPVRRTLYPYDHVTLSQNVMWDWLCESGAWSRYDVDTCAYIEVGRLHKKKVVDLYKSSYLPYVINLNGMVQIKKDSGFRRKVRRTVMTNHFPRDGEYPATAAESDAAVEAVPETSAENTGTDDLATESPVMKGASDINVENTKLAELPEDQPCSSNSCAVPYEANIAGENGIELLQFSANQLDDEHVSSVANGLEPLLYDPNVTLVENTNVVSIGEATSPSESGGVTSSALVTMQPSSQQQSNEDEEENNGFGQTQFEYLQQVFMAPTNSSHLITRAFAFFTAMMLAPIVPVLPRTPPIPVYIPPLSSRKNTRRVQGVRKPSSPGKSGQYSQQMDIVLRKYSRKCKKPPEDDCAICMMPLNEFSSFVVNENFTGNVQAESQIYQLKECMHTFHKTCVEELYKNGNRDGSLQCPTCKHVYGVLCGTQPPGNMHFHVIPFSLPGYPECETIQIIYNIPAGIQGLEHPSAGQEYTARGFPRKCYLPHNEQGIRVLKLLVIAWERRLIFTIGRSATSGEDNTVIWNDIHHKTEFGSNTTGHGFPDPCYFSNVLSELHAKNITESLLDQHTSPAELSSTMPRRTSEEVTNINSVVSQSHPTTSSNFFTEGSGGNEITTTTCVLDILIASTSDVCRSENSERVGKDAQNVSAIAPQTSHDQMQCKNPEVLQLTLSPGANSDVLTAEESELKCDNLTLYASEHENSALISQIEQT